MRAFDILIAGSALVFMAAAADARILSGNMTPAEIPPLSYKAHQYVDSKGCIYIRTGYGGEVSWAPRITQKRQVMCGAQPTAVAGASKPTAVATTTVQPTAVTQPVQTVQPTTTAETRRPRQVAAFDWTTFLFGTTRTERAAARTQTAVAPVMIVAAPVVVSQPAQVQVATVQTYANDGVWQVRTGPQAVHPSFYAQQSGVQVTRQKADAARSQVSVPAGYKSLLPIDYSPQTRGQGTAEGKMAMDLLWTQTMPRCLIDVTNGRDVTTTYPKIRYPYTTASSRSYALAGPTTTTTATTTKRTKAGSKPDEASPSNMKRITKIVDTLADLANDEPQTAALATGRFIQVATFGVPANAERALARFGQAGLPGQARLLRRGGKDYQIVMLGPFLDQAGLGNALTAARQAGFKDAFYAK